MSELTTTRICGIDEAGYGPLLGPLVISRADFEGDLSSMRRDHPELPVDDSKKVMQGPRGLERLETVVLGFRTLVDGRTPATVREWLSADLTGGDRVESNAPWYANLDQPLPIRATREDVEKATERLAKGELGTDFRFLGASISVMTEGWLNANWSHTDNKHQSLFDVVCELIEEAAERHGPLQVICDKLGGRHQYADKLRMAFPFTPVEAMEETPESSTYDIELATGPVSLGFRVKGDARHPEVALASMFAKYTREIFMHLFNRYWADVIPHVRPTAGYYTDGQRFLRDLNATGQVPGPQLDALARSR